MTALICQFYQYEHCKFADRCNKTNTSVTCDSFPCLDNTCDKRHPRKCKNYEAYGRCQFAKRCSFIPLSFSGHDTMASDVFHELVQEVKVMKE